MAERVVDPGKNQTRESDKRRSRHIVARLAVAVPAAGVTFALCLFMGRLIQAEFVEPPAKEVRELAAITPQIQDPLTDSGPRILPERLVSATPPPPPPKLTATKSDIDLPTPNLQGEAPRTLEFERMGALAVDPVVVNDVEARPISPPVPQFPRPMAERGTEGNCDVHFNVNARGEPFDINARCSDAGFKRAAEQAVARVRFAPKIVRGQPVERRNVVYPIAFNLEEG